MQKFDKNSRVDFLLHIPPGAVKELSAEKATYNMRLQHSLLVTIKTQIAKTKLRRRLEPSPSLLETDRDEWLHELIRLYICK